MIWRTCGSLSISSARRAYSTRAVGFVGPGGDQAEVLRRVGILAELAQAAGELGRGAERRHAVAADQAGDRRVVDARLLGELPLRHLLGLELGSQPLVERATVLGGHASLGAPLVACAGGAAMPHYRSDRPRLLYHPFVPAADRHTKRPRAVRCGLAGAGEGPSTAMGWSRIDRRWARMTGTTRTCCRVGRGPFWVDSAVRIRRVAAPGPREPSACAGSGVRLRPAVRAPRRRAAAVEALAAALARETDVGDRAEHDHRQDADRPVDEDDRERLGLADAVHERQQADDARPRRSRCRPGVSGTAVRSDAVSATKNAPLIPRWTSLKPIASTTRNSRIASVAQMRPVTTTSVGSGLSPTRPEHALLEPVVQLQDAVRQRQRG